MSSQLLCLFFCLFSFTPTLARAENTFEPPLNLTIEHYTLQRDGVPLYLKGVLYNPAALGTAPAWTYPWGAYLAPNFADMWARDFRLLRAMGANCLRVIGGKNHAGAFKMDGPGQGAFLDAAHAASFYVIVSFALSSPNVNPVQETWQQYDVLGQFQSQVGKYAHHPALIAWSFSASELNAPWSGYLQAVSNAHGCGWNPACLNSEALPGSACYPPVTCVYSNLFGYVNTAARMAKDALNWRPSHFILVGLTDADRLNDRLKSYEHVAPDVDGWALSVYRGRDFNASIVRNNTVETEDLLYSYRQSSKKPLVVTEFGVDAYNDPCGHASSSPCFNMAHEPPNGFGEDERQQADWLLNQATLLLQHSSAHTEKGVVGGAIVYEWLDEFWRQTTGVTGCYGPIPYGQPGFDPSMCDWKAHVDCPESDLWYHSLCGYAATSFDGYANVAWFGLVKVFPNPGYDMDTIVPRQAYDRLKELWGEPQGFLWIYLTLFSIVIACALASALYVSWLRRLALLESVGIERKSLFAVGDYRQMELFAEGHTAVNEDTPLLRPSR